jgi:hypothetical protein
MKPQDIQAGVSYACKYTDLAGKSCLAIIVKRDPEQELLVLRDLETDHEFTARYEDVHDIDTVEWVTDA